MTDRPIRTRFAPSPTGFLHIGGARTALFNWLFARAMGGVFLLRIEDTDRERSLPHFTDDIMESLRWLGMNWDEPPVFQSKRGERYNEIIDQMLKKGQAYRCECTPEELDKVRAQCEKEKRAFRYPGTCRTKGLTHGKTVIRAVIPSRGETEFEDCIRGSIKFQNRDFDDWVISRTDGNPTYNYAVVVDDFDQKITHVLRGDDHINNTPKQIMLYQTLGFAVPRFAHLPMIMGTDRAKLSKRHGAGSTLEYQKMGFLPEAIINFLVRMGWSHGDQEIFTVDELIKVFSLDKIGKANAIFNPEKLNWISGHFFREASSARLVNYLRTYFLNEIAFASGVDEKRFEAGVAIIQAKVKTILELIDQLNCLFGPDPVYEAGIKVEEKASTIERLREAGSVLSTSGFDKAGLEASVRTLVETRGEKLAQMAQALRFAVTGGKVSPGLFEMLEVQGRETVLRRIHQAVESLSRA
ncbi:MAG: glutamate--tRNA ligase [Deltaproteobacteria bacterium]|nr:glutamate--tRNA ligase [Deltaproteobacteria bacterium]MBI3295229.1 glutamate--tRNA ligase [Deltaproteobacteria bacterium]